MIENVIIKNDRVEVILTSGEKLYFTMELARELRDFLKELL